MADQSAGQSVDLRETPISGSVAAASATISLAPALAVPNLDIVPFGAMLAQVPEAIRHRYGSLLEELKSVIPQFFVQDMTEAIGDVSAQNSLLPDSAKIKLTQVLMAVEAYYKQILEKNNNTEKTKLSLAMLVTALSEACDILYSQTKSMFILHRSETPLEKNARELRDKLITLAIKYKINGKPEWIILSEPKIIPRTSIQDVIPPPAPPAPPAPPLPPVYDLKKNKPLRGHSSAPTVKSLESENRPKIGGLAGHIQQFLSQRASSTNEDRGEAITRAQEQRREALRQQELESNPLARRLEVYRRAIASDNSSDSDSDSDELKDSFIDEQRVSVTPQFSASITAETPDSPVQQLSDELNSLSLEEKSKAIKKPS